MNLGCKKITSIFLVFSLMMLSVNLYAKERRGANLLITKRNGQQIGGELITVKENSLLLFDTEGKDVSVDIADIEVIVIVKKSKVGKGALYGLLIGVIGGVLVGGIGGSGNEDYGFLGGAAFVTMFSAPGCALLGAGIGSSLGADKTIQLIGMTDLEKRGVLDKLRKKARVRDYK